MESIKKLEEESREYYAKWRETEEKLEEEKLKKVNLDFVGKFIKYKNPINDVLTCMYVRDVFEDTVRFASHRYAYVIRGFGFEGEYTGYPDATWFNFDFMNEIYIYGDKVDEFRSQVEKIEEMDPEDFRKSFELAIKSTSNKFNEYFNAILFGKNEDLTAE